MKRTRRAIQLAFLLLTVVGVFAVKGNAERWCPFGGVEAIYSYLREGSLLCSLGTSNFFILGGVLLSVVVLKRAFCGFACPIGALSEFLYDLPRWFRIKPIRVTGPADRALACLKYPVLLLILWATFRTGELMFRGYDPCYALLSRHGEDITYWAYVVSGAIVVASLMMVTPFCRWLCPFAAVMNPLSRLGLFRVRRDKASCTACGKCARVCPAAIPVDKVIHVTHARCIACTDCVDVCPKRQDGALFWGSPARLGKELHRALLIGLLLLCLGVAVGASYVAPLPSYVKTRGQLPAQVGVVELQLEGLTCRGRANLLVGFLDRDDLHQIPSALPGSPGYYKLEAWPGPGLARVRVAYDVSCTTDDAVKQAITQPIYELADDRWWNSPFKIQGSGAGAN